MAQEEVQMFPTTSLSLGSEELETPLDDLESVVALYQPRVFRFLLATLRDRDAAETLTQETFLRAWSARGSFREDCSMATWLIRIALNLAQTTRARDDFASGSGSARTRWMWRMLRPWFPLTIALLRNI